MIASLSQEKARLRRIARDRRAAACAANPQAALDMRSHFLNTVKLPLNAIVGGYYPVGDEMDVLPLLVALADGGITTALPVIGDNRKLIFRAWRTGDSLESGKYDVPSPLSTAPLVVPDFLLVPLLAFARDGARLGQGGGFYDHTIAALRREGAVTVIGIAYAAQEMPALPLDLHDQRLDMVITERGEITPPSACG